MNRNLTLSKKRKARFIAVRIQTVSTWPIFKKKSFGSEGFGGAIIPPSLPSLPSASCRPLPLAYPSGHVIETQKLSSLPPSLPIPLHALPSPSAPPSFPDFTPSGPREGRVTGRRPLILPSPGPTETHSARLKKSEYAAAGGKTMRLSGGRGKLPRPSASQGQPRAS